MKSKIKTALYIGGRQTSLDGSTGFPMGYNEQFGNYFIWNLKRSSKEYEVWLEVIQINLKENNTLYN